MDDIYRTRVRSLATLVSDLLTDCCLADLTDVPLASKCLDVLSVADADAKERVDNRFNQIL